MQAKLILFSGVLLATALFAGTAPAQLVPIDQDRSAADERPLPVELLKPEREGRFQSSDPRRGTVRIDGRNYPYASTLRVFVEDRETALFNLVENAQIRYQLDGRGRVIAIWTTQNGIIPS